MSAAVSSVVEIVTAEVVQADALAPAFVGLEVSAARQVREVFVPVLLRIEELERLDASIVVTDGTHTAGMKMADVARKEVKKLRVGVENNRKAMNEGDHARIKARNCAAGIVEGLLTPIEKRLLWKATFGEREAEARKNELRSSREETLRALDADPSLFASLGDMTPEAWTSTLATATNDRDARTAKAKEEEEIRRAVEKSLADKREAERQERIAEAAARAERDRIRDEENARLKREASEAKAIADAEMAKLAEENRVQLEKAARLLAEGEAERKAVEAMAKAEREAAAEETRKAQAEVKRLEAEQIAAATAERVKAEAEVARLEAAVAADEASRQAADLAPDREKLKAFADALRAVTLPVLSSERGQLATTKIAEEIEKLSKRIEKTAASL